MMDPVPVIDIKDLSFSYNHSLVLDTAGLKIQERDFVSIVGPNGGGKTTLLKLILGLLTPREGEIRIFGRSPEEARPWIGYMPQHARLDPQFPVSVYDVVLMGRLGEFNKFGPYSLTDKGRALDALKEVNLYKERHRSFATLSGGQQQRALIARALSCEPRLLLLDEPTSSLDILVEGEFYELLKALNKRLTVVIVSHDVGFVSQFVKTIVCVNQKVASHPIQEITSEIISQTFGSNMRILHHHHD